MVNRFPQFPQWLSVTRIMEVMDRENYLITTSNWYAAGPKIGNYLEQEGQDERDTMLEDPNDEAQRFFEMLKAAQTPLWGGCNRYSMLSASLTLIGLKAEYSLSQGCFNALVKFIGNALPDSNCMPKSFYQAKK